MEEIISMEWEMFQAVKNEGGRAACQDNWPEFQLMRSAQFSQWPTALRESYRHDLKQACSQGRNLVMEKYAWMMESTAPDQFTKIQPYLTAPPQSCTGMIEKIIAIQVRWMKEYVCKYPNIATRGRAIFSEQDYVFSTSGETYLRGELRTYSKATITLYAEFVDKLFHNGENLHIMVLEQVCAKKGYPSLAAAEENIAH